MATTLAQLDAALVSLSSEVSVVSSDINNLIAKISSGQDFTSELSSVQASLGSLQAADASAQAVLNPPAPASPPSA